MKNKTELLFFIIILLFLSCTTEEVVDLKDMYECKPVVYSVISPQNDTIRVLVSRTYAFGEEYDKSKPAIDNALVTLSAKGQSAQLPFSTSSDQYEIATNNFPLLEGQTYHIEVVLPTGEKATAETTIPTGNFRIDSVVTTKTGPFLDDAFQDYYYYRFTSAVYSKINHDESGIIFLDYEKVEDRYCINYNENIYAFNKAFNDDSSRHFLFIIDETLQNYTLNTRFVHVGQNPENEFDVFKGVYPEYTNIENGYGVFSSYLRSEPFYIYYRF